MSNSSLPTIPLETRSEEEIRETFLSYYRRNPNDLSKWYPKVKDFFLTPKTEIIRVPDELVTAFFMEKPDDRRRIASWVHEKVMPVAASFKGDIFVKNGCFSNKFNFNKGCHISHPLTEDDVIEHIIDIQYSSFFCDTGGNLEIVLREYIPSERDTIYNGMPLRPELRVFYDFDNKKYLYDANYWDWDYCHDAICRNTQDKAIYEAVYPELVKELDAMKEKYLPFIKDNLAKVNMTGLWSVDFLFEDKVFLIDMAVAQASAYFDRNRILSSY